MGSFNSYILLLMPNSQPYHKAPIPKIRELNFIEKMQIEFWSPVVVVYRADVAEGWHSVYTTSLETWRLGSDDWNLTIGLRKSNLSAQVLTEILENLEPVNFLSLGFTFPESRSRPALLLANPEILTAVMVNAWIPG